CYAISGEAVNAEVNARPVHLLLNVVSDGLAVHVRLDAAAQIQIRRHKLRVAETVAIDQLKACIEWRIVPRQPERQAQCLAVLEGAAEHELRQAVERLLASRIAGDRVGPCAPETLRRPAPVLCPRHIASQRTVIGRTGETQSDADGIVLQTLERAGGAPVA